jgi:hypothetical protein
MNPLTDTHTAVPPSSTIIYPNTIPGLVQPYETKPAIQFNGYSWDYSAFRVPEQFQAVNSKLVCEPFKTNVVQKKERSGFATANQKVTLTPLKVFVGTPTIPTGSTVYVRSEACAAGWGKEVYESEGMPPFILIPETEVVYVKRWETPPYHGGWTLTNGTATEPALPYTTCCATNKEG